MRRDKKLSKPRDVMYTLNHSLTMSYISFLPQYNNSILLQIWLLKQNLPASTSTEWLTVSAMSNFPCFNQSHEKYEAAFWQTWKRTNQLQEAGLNKYSQIAPFAKDPPRNELSTRTGNVCLPGLDILHLNVYCMSIWFLLICIAV